MRHKPAKPATILSIVQEINGLPAYLKDKIGALEALLDLGFPTGLSLY
jgi:hypothetical protein